jgi:dephospho-CoA kinase
MLKVGITGGIGTGKSTVCKIFAAFNIAILDSDTLAKQIVANNVDARQKIIDTFGEDVFVSGVLQKQILATKAFSSAENTAKLNAIIHPQVQLETEEWFSKQTSLYAIKEAALMIESGAYKKLDVLIGISAPEDVRIKRVLHRDKKLTAHEVLQRISRQMPEADKVAYCHYTIINDDVQLLLPQVLSLHHLLLQKCYEKQKH